MSEEQLQSALAAVAVKRRRLKKFLNKVPLVDIVRGERKA